MNICVKNGKFSSVANLVHPFTEEELGVMLPYYLKKIRKSFSRHEKSSAHVSVVLMKTNVGIKDTLSKSDKKMTEEKIR